METAFCTRFLAIIFCFCSLAFCYGQNEQSAHKVYLFGNTSDVENLDAFILNLKTELQKDTNPFVVILNGDMANEQSSNTYQTTLENVFHLADMVEGFPNGKLLLIPGDRDWNNGNKGGEKSVKKLEKDIKKYLKDNDYKQTKWTVKKACPGPKVIEVDDALVIITVDTQWWNHEHDKPRASDGTCDVISQANLKEELEDAVEENHDKNILIVGHHPIYSLGNYGGRFSVGDEFKPFPILGSFRTAYHANIGNKNDISNQNLHSFVEDINNLMYFHSNLIYASSHEKNQQIIKRGNNFLINSGALQNPTYSTKDENTVLTKKASGVMAIKYFADGKVDATFLSLENNALKPTDNYTLFHSSCNTDNASMDESKLNTSYVPCRKLAEATSKMSGTFDGFEMVEGGSEYEVSKWKKMWFGNHYRTTWTKPVKVPYLNLDTTFNGLEIYKKGGGRQTTSLKFKSGDGTVYTFRSVNKDPAKALTYKLRPTVMASVLRDQTSTEQPYGAMATAPLLDKLDILHADPTLYVLPDDTKLGGFQSKYGGLLGMLEVNPGKSNNEGEVFGGADKITKSTELVNDLYSKQKRKVNQTEFARARIFDMFVGDWSKHEDNWKWAKYKKDDGWAIYRPIPRDRDHVFSLQDGIIPWIADRRFALTYIENFGTDYKDILSLTYQARHMDRFFLSEADKDVFIAQAEFIQNHLNDQDIENAVRNMPIETYDESGKEIEMKLKNRLKTLKEAALKYYALLAKEVDVVGSSQKENFEINYLENGNVEVKSFSKKGDDLLYHRIFLPEDTKEVRVYGLSGNDKFRINGDSDKSKIRVRTFGGPGDDTFHDTATNQKTLIYDKGDETKYDINGKAKVVDYWNKDLYEFDRTRFEYNRTLPLIALSFNQFTGLGLGLGALITTRDFDKDTYHSTHNIYGFASTENNYSISYSGRFHQAFKKWDFTTKLQYTDGDFFNFFYGLGGNSENDDDLFDDDFYEAEVNKIGAKVGVIRDFWKQSSFSLSIGIEQNESDPIQNTFLNENAATIFGANEELTILPFETSLDIDFRDSKGLPYKGTRALFAYENGTILEGDNENYGVASGSLEYYLSTKAKNPFTFGFRLGGAVTHGDNIPWYKLPTLGNANGLRGYRQNRFTGDTNAYVNLELRYQLFERNTSFVPVKVGVKVFYDRGRTFLSDDSDSNSDFRNGYGFGFYLVPLTESFTVSLGFGFSDEESILPAFATGTPLR